MITKKNLVSHIILKTEKQIISWLTKQLKKKWESLIYSFFSPSLGVNNHWKCHIFTCLQKHCKKKIFRYLDKHDAHLTSNLQWHAQTCWGLEVLTAANSASDKETCQSIVQNYQCSGKVTEFFNWKTKGETTYSNIQHIAIETRAEIVRWVCENLCPFKIVKNWGFNHLMKTGHPNYYILSLSTIGYDVKKVFARVWKQIIRTLWVS